MSRSRNIKPGFFKNEELAELPFEYRILFQGLWCLADRAGRLEDRPKRIKAEVFPYDDVHVSAGLDALHKASFIARYEVGGVNYIEVVNFTRHQNPHCKESVSTIPAPCSPGAIPGISGTSTADSLNLIPDSPIPSKATPAAPDGEGRFDDWWAVYPKRVKRKVAVGIWKRRKLDAVADRLIADVLNRSANDDNWQRGYAPDPTTYLNQDRWDDEVRSAPVARAGPVSAPSKTLSAIHRLEDMKNGLAGTRTADGLPEVALLGVGSDPGD
jgi:hypothetical protein